MLTEQLRVFALFIFDAMPFNHGDKVPLGIPAQRCFAEMRICGQVIFRCYEVVSEVTATTARHEDLFAWFIGFFQHDDPPPTSSRGHGAHQAGGASTQDDDIV